MTGQFEPAKEQLLALMRERISHFRPGAQDPLRVLYALTGNKWTTITLSLLTCGSSRFLELHRYLQEIMQEPVSRRMLAFTLRRLEREGLIKRAITDGNVARVDYALTPLGGKVACLIREMAALVREHEEEILEARMNFDARPENSKFHG